MKDADVMATNFVLKQAKTHMKRLENEVVSLLLPEEMVHAPWKMIVQLRERKRKKVCKSGAVFF